MPLSPELKILDLIIEAANEVRKSNPLSTGVAFSHFSKRLAEMKRELNDEGSTHPQETEGEEWWDEYIHDEPFSGRAAEPHRMVLPSELENIISLAEAKGAEKERERISTVIQEIASRTYGDELREWEIVQNVRESMGKELLKAITPPTP